MGNNNSSADYTYDTLARDIVQVYQSHTMVSDKGRAGSQRKRSSVKRLISEEKRANRKEQQSNRLTLSDMELECDGQKCR